MDLALNTLLCFTPGLGIVSNKYFQAYKTRWTAHYSSRITEGGAELHLFFPKNFAAPFYFTINFIPPRFYRAKHKRTQGQDQQQNVDPRTSQDWLQHYPTPHLQPCSPKFREQGRKTHLKCKVAIPVLWKGGNPFLFNALKHTFILPLLQCNNEHTNLRVPSVSRNC